MKIYCTCGNTIYDQTDAISYKASFVADQDYLDLFGAIDAQIETLATALQRKPADQRAAASAVQRTMHDIHTVIRTLARRTMYQCVACGRLFVDDARFASHVFEPSDATVPKNLLGSIEGDRWKRPLRGSWSDWKHDGPKGELWWGFGDAEEGFEQFDDFDTLQQRYFDVFARLRHRDIVRDALLQNGNEIIHQWP